MDVNEKAILQNVWKSGTFIEDLSIFDGQTCKIIGFNETKLMLRMQDGTTLYIYTDLPGDYVLTAYRMEK